MGSQHGKRYRTGISANLLEGRGRLEASGDDSESALLLYGSLIKRVFLAHALVA